MNKITDASTYEEFEKYCVEKGYSLSALSSKKCYFLNKDREKYSSLICWIDRFKESHTSKQKITYAKAKEYLDKYGATKAVKVLAEEGVVITRQGLYKAANND